MLKLNITTLVFEDFGTKSITSSNDYDVHRAPAVDHRWQIQSTGHLQQKIFLILM